jgi:hypothetical protein
MVGVGIAVAELGAEGDSRRTGPVSMGDMLFELRH